jgi:hypothetical protein
MEGLTTITLMVPPLALSFPLVVLLLGVVITMLKVMALLGAIVIVVMKT